MSELASAAPEAANEKAISPATAEPVKVQKVEVESPADKAQREEAALKAKLSEVWKKSQAEKFAEANPNKPAPTPDKPADKSGEQKAPESAPKRGPDGKFTSANPEAKQSDQKPIEGKVEQAKSATEKPADTKPAIDMPKSWSPEKKALWDGLSPEAREHITAREQQAHKAITDLGQKVKATEKLTQVIDQYKGEFERYGITPDVGINELLKTHAALERDPKTVIAALAQRYGVTLGQSESNDGGFEDPQVGALKGQVQQLQQQIAQLRQGLEGRAQQEAEQGTRQRLSMVDEFAKDKAEFADPEFGHEVVDQLIALKARNPDLSPQEALQKAYEKALWASPKARAAKLAADQAKAEAERIEAAKKAKADAEANQHLAIGNGATEPAGEVDHTERLRAIWRKNRAA